MSQATEQYKHAADYVDHIFKGASQANFPSRRRPNMSWSST